MTIDYTGSYFRRDGLGGAYIGGVCPLPEEEPGTDNLEVDHQYFDDKLWPNLANRVPAFNSLKVRKVYFISYCIFLQYVFLGSWCLGWLL